MLQESDIISVPVQKKDFFAVSGESHRGLLRKKNEDNFSLVRYSTGDRLLVVVADGIGGHSRGEMASYICCRELTCAFMKKAGKLDSPEEAAKFLQSELERINEAIYLRNRSNRSLRRPMGTTVNCAVFLGDSVVMGNAGDSRLYEFSQDESVRQLSTDHSFKAALAAEGVETHRHGLGNVIYRAVGLHRNFELELKTFSIAPGNRYLLCTDGMYRSLEDQHIAQIIRHAASPSQALNEFMRSALIAGGSDNITGIAVFVPGDQK